MPVSSASVNCGASERANDQRLAAPFPLGYRVHIRVGWKWRCSVDGSWPPSQPSYFPCLTVTPSASGSPPGAFTVNSDGSPCRSHLHHRCRPMSMRDGNGLGKRGMPAGIPIGDCHAVRGARSWCSGSHHWSDQERVRPLLGSSASVPGYR